jgi:SAM-dependent methyltransferase
MKQALKKYYEGHEVVYRWMRKSGIHTWGQTSGGNKAVSCKAEFNKFLKDILSRSWMPKSGRVLELGCGTGPILRHVCKKGFRGVGIDISRTAIAMAREQSQGLNIKFKQADVCALDGKTRGKFDIVIDGLCLHCIISAKERQVVLNNTFRILKTGGIFVLYTMCSPIDRKQFYETCKNHKIVRNLIYVSCKDRSYEKLSKFNGTYYLPIRYIGHWKDILVEVHKAGFQIKLFRYDANNENNFCSTLAVAAAK